MSDCYTTFYFELPLPNKETADLVDATLSRCDGYWDKSDLEKQAIIDDMSQIFAEFCEYEELGFEWNVREVKATRAPNETKTVWNLTVFSDEAGNVEHATELIQWLLPKLDIKGAGFEYAQTGGGENGGGAVACIKTDDGVETDWMNTHTWLAEKLG